MVKVDCTMSIAKSNHTQGRIDSASDIVVSKVLIGGKWTAANARDKKVGIHIEELEDASVSVNVAGFEAVELKTVDVGTREEGILACRLIGIIRHKHPGSSRVPTSQWCR